MRDSQEHTIHNGSAEMVYIYVAGCWVSGNVESECGDVKTVRLVTGHRVCRLASEVRATSPRLDDPNEWPL
jgi:hypothetical protein